MGKVFVTQEVPRLDYSKAAEFGGVVFLSAMDLSSEKNSLHNVAIIDGMRDKLRDFDPEHDYLVPSGSPIVAAAAFMLVREKAHRVSVLKWSNRDFLYSVVHINL